MTNSTITPHKRSVAPSWSQSEDEILTANYQKPIKDLAVLLPNRSANAIEQRLRKVLGLPVAPAVRKTAWTPEDISYLRANYGKTTSVELCKRLGRKKHAIAEYARKQGLTIPKDENGDTVNTIGKASLRRLLDGSLQSCYWMGYLMADGYMHHGLGQIVLASAEADKDHMGTYATYLGGKAHCYRGISDFTGLSREHYRVSIADRRAAAKIAQKYDWKPRKTYNPPSIDILSRAFDTNDHFLAFLIGFIDGDGHIVKSHHGIRVENHASWIDFHQFLLDTLRRIGIVTRDIKAAINGDGYSDFNLNHYATEHLKRFIDKHQLTILTRKWDKINSTKPSKI